MQDIEVIYSITIAKYQSSNKQYIKVKYNDQYITAIGPIYNFYPKGKYTLNGFFSNNSKYGLQFNYVSCLEKDLLKHKEIVEFFSSELFESIGEKTAIKIVEHFGIDTVEILFSNLENINKLDIKPKQKSLLTQSIEKLIDKNSIDYYKFLSYGLNKDECDKIFYKFKSNALNIASENPFKFYYLLDSIRIDNIESFSKYFDIVDKQLKIDQFKTFAKIKQYLFNTGSSFIYDEEIYNLDIDRNLLKYLIDEKYVIEKDKCYYLYNTFNDEKNIAFYLKRLNNFNQITFDLDNILKEYEINNNITFHSKQKEAIKLFFNNDFSIITGGPGTGKTTIIDAIYKILHLTSNKSKIAVVSPTGRSAKRINEICNINAKTIHSLLGFNMQNYSFKYDALNPIDVDYVIVDEISMVSNEIFNRLLMAIKNVKKLLIIGDYNQLPSISIGNVLNDLLKSKCFASIDLKYNFRQNEGSNIIDLAYDILEDDFNPYRFNNLKDVHVFNIEDAYKLLPIFIKNDLNEGYNFNDIQIICPFNKKNEIIEKYTCYELNKHIQSIFNTNPFIKEFSNFKINDKVINLENDSSNMITNGDIGYVIENLKMNSTNIINVKFDEAVVSFSQTKANNQLDLAYAITVHKAQGCEFSNVYVVISKKHYIMLDKRLIYTAITRCKKKLVIFIENDFTNKHIRPTIIRNTSLDKMCKY